MNRGDGMIWLSRRSIRLITQTGLVLCSLWSELNKYCQDDGGCGKERTEMMEGMKTQIFYLQSGAGALTWHDPCESKTVGVCLQKLWDCFFKFYSHHFLICICCICKFESFLLKGFIFVTRLQDVLTLCLTGFYFQDSFFSDSLWGFFQILFIFIYLFF